jgi:hypothetical protein
MPLQIFYDELQEGQWFRSLAPQLSNAGMNVIGARGANPQSIESLLRYDRPDIVLVVDGKPKLVVEKTTEVPTGHNVGQRFGRIANAVEEQVMFAYFFPFKAMKHGEYANVCYVNARLFEAFRKMETIHDVPVLAIDWPCDSQYEIIRDGSEDSQMKTLVKSLILNQFKYKDVEIIGTLRQRMDQEYSERVTATPSYANPPPSVDIVETKAYLDSLESQFRNVKIPDYVRRRAETLVYRFDMTPPNCRREDPYTGTQFIYDYIWCRNGPLPKNKYRNLVLYAPLVPVERWIEANPNDSRRKSSLYYATADFMVLKDGIVFPNDALVKPGQQRL